MSTEHPSGRPDSRFGSWAERVVWHRRGIVVTRGRLAQVVAIVALAALALALPYLTLQYLDKAVQVTQSTERVVGAGGLVGGLDASWLPSFYRPEYGPVAAAPMNRGLNLIALAAGAQLIGGIVALACCWALLIDEINRIFWWPLHLAGYPLLLAPVPLLFGVNLLRNTGVLIDAGPAWLSAVLAGGVVLVVSVRARRRIDSYGGL